MRSKVEAHEQPRPAVFLDRDGVINYDFGYVAHETEFRWIPGAIRTIRTFNEAGWMVFVVSNQAAIARGYARETDVDALHIAIRRELARHGASLTKVYICPFHPMAITSAYRDPNHFDRKPNPGMLLKAKRDSAVDWSVSFLIGDRPSDIEAAQAAGLPGHLFRGINLYSFCESQGLLPVQ